MEMNGKLKCTQDYRLKHMKIDKTGFGLREKFIGSGCISDWKRWWSNKRWERSAKAEFSRCSSSHTVSSDQEGNTSEADGEKVNGRRKEIPEEEIQNGLWAAQQ